MRTTSERDSHHPPSQDGGQEGQGGSHQHPTNSRPRPTQRTLIRGDGEGQSLRSRIRQGQPSPEAPIPVNTSANHRSVNGGTLPKVWRPSQNAMTHARHISSKITAKRIFIMGDWA